MGRAGAGLPREEGFLLDQGGGGLVMKVVFGSRTKPSEVKLLGRGGNRACKAQCEPGGARI